MTAAEFIIDRVMAHPGEVTLIPIGPLTNIALALRLEPRIAENVREVVLMGGNAFCPGNASPAAEANILNDPEAADVVFGAPWSVTMVGLDVTHRVNMTKSHLAEYGRIDNPLAQHIHRIVPHYVNFFETYYDIDGIYVHDSSAVAYVIDPSLFRCVQAPIRVDTDGGISRGKTWPSMSKRTLPPWEHRPPVNIPIEVDSARLTELELSRLRAFAG
jgi:inosine-uridine nucleoside N-ribohydrolase